MKTIGYGYDVSHNQYEPWWLRSPRKNSLIGMVSKNGVMWQKISASQFEFGIRSQFKI